MCSGNCSRKTIPFRDHSQLLRTHLLHVFTVNVRVMTWPLTRGARVALKSQPNNAELLHKTAQHIPLDYNQHACVCVFMSEEEGVCAHKRMLTHYFFTFWILNTDTDTISCSESGIEVKNCVYMCPYVSLWVSENKLVIKSVSKQQMTAASGSRRDQPCSLGYGTRPRVDTGPLSGSLRKENLHSSKRRGPPVRATHSPLLCEHISSVILQQEQQLTPTGSQVSAHVEGNKKTQLPAPLKLGCELGFIIRFNLHQTWFWVSYSLRYWLWRPFLIRLIPKVNQL